MNPTRYEELLGRLLDGELSEAEAEELARGIGETSALREDLRQHLLLWELLSQEQAPERSADAFVNAWKTRHEIEGEPAEAFSQAVGKQLRGQSLTQGVVHAFRVVLGHPLRLSAAASLLLVALFTAFWLSTPRSAQGITTISGEAVCTACLLHESKKHEPAIRVREGAEARIYHLDRTPVVSGLQMYFCTGPRLAIAKGKARTAQGQLLFDAASLTLPDVDNTQKSPPKTP